MDNNDIGYWLQRLENNIIVQNVDNSNLENTENEDIDMESQQIGDNFIENGEQQHKQSGDDNNDIDILQENGQEQHNQSNE